jgi:hypothetical protein
MDVVAVPEGAAMNYRGVDYTVVETTTRGVWKWQFQIGDSVRSGRTETRIELMARRRVQLQINHALSAGSPDMPGNVQRL